MNKSKYPFSHTLDAKLGGKVWINCLLTISWKLMEKYKQNWDVANQLETDMPQSVSWMFRIFQNHCILTFQPNQCTYALSRYRSVYFKVQCFVCSIMWPSHSNSLSPMPKPNSSSIKTHVTINVVDQLGAFSPLIHLSE